MRNCYYEETTNVVLERCPIQDCAKVVRNPALEHITAQRDVEFFNSMIEAANKNLKYHVLYHKDIADSNSLCHYLSEAISDFNNRPYDVLNGLTPLEMLGGKTINKNAAINLFIKKIIRGPCNLTCNYYSKLYFYAKHHRRMVILM